MNDIVYWKWDNKVSSERCKEIIDDAGDNFQPTGIEDYSYGAKGQGLFQSDDQKLFDLGSECVLEANKKSGWNFEYSAMESFQIGKFPQGGHYNWHVDGIGTHKINAPNNKLMHGKTRKISMVLWLNDDFEGGEFEFHPSHLKDNIIKPSVGTIIMFPSWIMHRVKPVTKGVRYNAVTWIVGNPVQ